MNSLTTTHNTEKTIFLQAIDQNYENNKIYKIFCDISEEQEKFEDFENGDLKLNFDFIEFSEENNFTLNLNMKKHKNSDYNLSNSSISSESTEIEISNATHSPSNICITEKTNTKISDFLNKKYKEDLYPCLIDEIQKIKENIKKDVFEKNKFKINYFNCNNKNFNCIKNLNYNLPLNSNNYSSIANRNLAFLLNNQNIYNNSKFYSFSPQFQVKISESNTFDFVMEKKEKDFA